MTTTPWDNFLALWSTFYGSRPVPPHRPTVTPVPPVPPVPPSPPVPPVPPLPPSTTLRVGPTATYKTIAAAAVAAPAGASVIVDPAGNPYHESVHFPLKVSLASSDTTKKVVVDVTGLALVNDMAALLFDGDYSVTGFEIFGATGKDATNAAGVRGMPGVAGTLHSCNIHTCQTNILHTGGTLDLVDVDSHHNTGGNQEHTLYHAQFDTFIPLRTTIRSSRIYHCSWGNAVKSNAKSVEIHDSFIGTLPVPKGTSVPASWMTPLPTAPNTEWLQMHTGCVSNGYCYDGKAVDIPHAGALLIDNCDIFTGGSSGVIIGVGYELAPTDPGNGGAGMVTNTRFYIERNPTYMGSRANGYVLTFAKTCTYAGVYYSGLPTIDTSINGVPVPGAAVVYA